MKITASEDRILIEGWGRYNQTVKLVYSTKHNGWLAVRKDRKVSGRGMSLDQVLAWAKMNHFTN